MNASTGLGIVGVIAVALAGCGAADSGSGSGASGGWSAFEGSGGAAPGSADAGSAGGAAKTDAGAALPPEKEPEGDFGAPEGSPNFVYIPATGDDQLVRIAGGSLKVSLVEVSAQPSVVKVVPGQDAALVLHKGADELAIVRSTDQGDVVTTVTVLPHCNALAVDPVGKHAIAWYDHARAHSGDPVGSFQGLSLVRLQPGKDEALGVSTGFRPRAVAFTADGSKALIVTEADVNVIELATAKQGEFAARVPVTLSPLAKVEREVLTTDDGVWAVVREAGKSSLAMVHLPSKKIVEVALPAPPTDLDLVPGGKYAIAVLRDAGQVARLDLPAVATSTFAVSAAPMGDLVAGLARVTDDGKTAVLYTSVSGVEVVATLDVASGMVLPVAIKKTVDAVLPVAGTRKAVLVHRPVAGPGYDDPTEKFIDDANGYTLFDLDSGYTKLVLTPVRPAEIAFSAAPAKAWLLLPDPAGVGHAVQSADLTTFLTTDHALGSKPEHARALAKAGVVAVTQTHPSGRVTFLDGTTGAAKTVTGYQLNGKVK